MIKLVPIMYLKDCLRAHYYYRFVTSFPSCFYLIVQMCVGGCLLLFLSLSSTKPRLGPEKPHTVAFWPRTSLCPRWPSSLKNLLFSFPRKLDQLDPTRLPSAALVESPDPPANLGHLASSRYSASFNLDLFWVF